MIEIYALLSLIAGFVVIGAWPSHPLENCDLRGARALQLRRAELRGASILGLIGGGAGLVLLALAQLQYGLAVGFGLLGVVFLTLLHPWPLVRAVLIPAGAWRMALKVTRRCGSPWLRDPEGGAALAAVLACRRLAPQRVPFPQIEVFLGRAPLRGAGVVAVALMEQRRGELKAARQLMESLDDLDPAIVPPLARKIALDWRIAGAAAREEWDVVLSIADYALDPSATSKLLILLARQFCDQTIASGDLLRAWLRAPHRRSTWPLVQSALQGARIVADAALPAANAGGLLGTSTMAAHLEVAQAAESGAASSRQLSLAAEAWDQTWSDFDVRRRVRERALALGCRHSVEEHFNVLRREASQHLVACLATSPVRGSRLRGAENRWPRPRELRAALRGGLRVLGQSPESQDILSSWRVWQKWCEVRRIYEHYAARTGGQDLMDAFLALERTLCEVLAWLWVKRDERGLAHSMACWLGAEAERLGVADAAYHHRTWSLAGP